MTELEFKSLALQGFNRIPLDRRGVRRSRDAALALPEARLWRRRPTRRPAARQPLQLPARVGGRRRALRPLLVHRPAGAHAVARTGFRSEVVTRRRRSSRPTTATRSTSSPPTSSAFASPCGPACRAFAAAWPATSATTRCATSSRAWPNRRARGRCRIRSARPTSCSCSARKSRSSTTSRGGCTSSSTPTRPCPRPSPRRAGGCSSSPIACARASPRRRSSACRHEPVRREFAKADFLAAVARAKDYIAAGDLMQVQVGQRISKRYAGSPLSLYRALRSLNPSPYMYFYDMGEFQIVGASPEILVRREATDAGDKVTIRPLAGTRPRGATPELDARPRGRARRRPEGARRAPDADRPGAERHRPDRQGRQRQGDRGVRGRALLARDAHRQQRRRAC